MEGKTPSERDLLKIEEIGEARVSFQRYKEMAEIPSGPEPRVVASNGRAARTSSGVNDNENGRNENYSGVIGSNCIEDTIQGLL